VEQFAEPGIPSDPIYTALFIPNATTTCMDLPPAGTCQLTTCPAVQGSSASAGTVQLTGTSSANTLTLLPQPSAGSGTYYPVEFFSTQNWSLGPITITAPGDAAPGFTGGVVVPPMPDVLAPSLSSWTTLDTSQDLPVAWSPQSSDVLVLLEAGGFPFPGTEADSSAAIECVFSGPSGAGTLQAAQMKALKAQSSSYGTLVIASAASAVVTEGGWHVTINAINAGADADGLTLE